MDKLKRIIDRHFMQDHSMIRTPTFKYSEEQQGKQDLIDHTCSNIIIIQHQTSKIIIVIIINHRLTWPWTPVSPCLPPPRQWAFPTARGPNDRCRKRPQRAVWLHGGGGRKEEKNKKKKQEKKKKKEERWEE